jgi:hypothetical protein
LSASTASGTMSDGIGTTAIQPQSPAVVILSRNG